jgi:hypothetical protein
MGYSVYYSAFTHRGKENHAEIRTRYMFNERQSRFCTPCLRFNVSLLTIIPRTVLIPPIYYRMVNVDRAESNHPLSSFRCRGLKVLGTSPSTSFGVSESTQGADITLFIRSHYFSLRLVIL